MIQFSLDFLCSMRLWFTLLLCRHSYCRLRAIFQFVKSETLSGPIFHLVWQFGLVLLRNLSSSLLCSAKKDEAFIPWPYKFHYNMSLVSEFFGFSSSFSTSWNRCWSVYSACGKVFSPSISPAAHICLGYKCHYSLIWFVDDTQELRRKEEAAARGISFFSYVYPIITRVLLQY